MSTVNDFHHLLFCDSCKTSNCDNPTYTYYNHFRVFKCTCTQSSYITSEPLKCTSITVKHARLPPSPFQKPLNSLENNNSKHFRGLVYPLGPMSQHKAGPPWAPPSFAFLCQRPLTFAPGAMCPVGISTPFSVFAPIATHSLVMVFFVPLLLFFRKRTWGKGTSDLHLCPNRLQFLQQWLPGLNGTSFQIKLRPQTKCNKPGWQTLSNVLHTSNKVSGQEAFSRK